MHLDGGRPGGHLEPAGVFGGDQHGADLLVDLDHADPEEVLDQREDRTGVPLQQPADRRIGAVDVVLGPAVGVLGADGLPETEYGQPFLALGQPGPGGEFGVERDHPGGLDLQAGSTGERQQIVDGHVVLGVGTHRDARYHHGARPGSRGNQIVVAKPPQRLPDGVAADREPFAQFMFGGQLGSHRIHALDDLLAQGAGHLQVTVIGGGDGHVDQGPAQREDATLAVGGDVQRAVRARGDPGERALRPGERRHALERFGRHSRRRADGQTGCDRRAGAARQVDLDHRLLAGIDDEEPAVAGQDALGPVQAVDDRLRASGRNPHHAAGFGDQDGAVGGDGDTDGFVETGSEHLDAGVRVHRQHPTGALFDHHHRTRSSATP